LGRCLSSSAAAASRESQLYDAVAPASAAVVVNQRRRLNVAVVFCMLCFLVREVGTDATLNRSSETRPS